MLWWTLRLLKNGVPKAREAAARKLAEADDPRAVPALIGALDDPDAGVAGAAADVLGTRTCTASFEALAGVLKRPPGSPVRAAVARALGRCGNRDAIMLLAIALADADPDVRQSAAEALSRLDPDWRRSSEAKRAEWSLMLVLRSESSPGDVIEAAARTLGAIGAKDAVLPLVSTLRHRHARAAVLTVLDAIDPNWADPESIRSVILDLIAGQLDKNRDEDGEALRVIAAAGNELAAGIAALETGRAVAVAMGVKLLPALVHELLHGSFSTRDNASWAFSWLVPLLGPDASAALPMLAEALEDPYAAEHAIQAIATFGPAARDLAPRILAFWLKDDGYHWFDEKLARELEIRDPTVLDPYLRRLFNPKRREEPWPDFLRELLPPAVNFAADQLTGQPGTDLASLICEAASMDPDWSHARLDPEDASCELVPVSLARADRAVQALCIENTAVTSNVLHLIATREDVEIVEACSDPTVSISASFAHHRATATAELAKRGNPPYDLAAYRGG